jgi:nucleotide-binding universal stress UspA family protein
MNIKKLLVPTDFSSYNDAAFDYAQKLAAESGAVLYVAHVDELSDVNPEMADTKYLYASALGGDDRRKVRERLRRIRPTLDGIVCKHHYLLGLPAEEILQFAKQEGIDLIVMGSHGRTGLSRLLMGSVAESVMRKATCAVLDIKQSTLCHESAGASRTDVTQV